MVAYSNVSYLYIINEIAHRSVAHVIFYTMHYKRILWLKIVLLFIQLV